MLWNFTVRPSRILLSWDQGCPLIILWFYSLEGAAIIPNSSWPRPRVDFHLSIIFLSHIWHVCAFGGYFHLQFSSVQLLSHVWLFATPWIAAHQSSLSIINTQNSLKFTSIESVMPSSHLILCCPLLLMPPILPSIRVFSNESTLRMRWPKYWSFSFSIIPSKEHPGPISFRMYWLDLLEVQGTLKSPLQHYSWKASILRHSALFIVQFSHPYLTTGKNQSFDKTDFCWQSNVSAF